EYARDIIYNVTDVCDEERVPHPDIVSESGRAIVAHHSVLVVEAFGSIEKVSSQPVDASAEDHKLIKDLLYTQQHLSVQNLAESWHDLQQVKEESQKMFELGLLNLDIKAR